MLYTSGSDYNGRILGKRKPFRVKQKVFLTETSSQDAIEHSSWPINVQK
jgi:hypothetical protein